MNMIKTIACASVLTVGSMGAIAGSANALPIDVYAQANSSTGGTLLDTGIDLSIGDHLIVGVDLNDVWSAGTGGRTSNADGLAPGNPYGSAFPTYTQDGLEAYYGSLVGRIGAGDYFLVGTSYDAIVSEAGRLYFTYWDSNASDNSDFVTAFVTANVDVSNSVPEPATLGLLGVGLLGLGLLRRRKAA